jgi:23S rRNA A1618 N6-methylase RlmF
LDWINQISKIEKLEADLKLFDVGIGINCIYPILAAAKYRWVVSGSDIT